MRRIGRWFAVKMVGADVVGVVGLPKFPRTSAEFPPSAAPIHVLASVISQCQVGSEKTTFHGLHYVGLCILSRNRMSPSPNFIQGTIFPGNLGISRKRETQRSNLEGVHTLRCCGDLTCGYFRGCRTEAEKPQTGLVV